MTGATSYLFIFCSLTLPVGYFQLCSINEEQIFDLGKDETLFSLLIVTW
jgi:hypothetical protein